MKRSGGTVAILPAEAIGISTLFARLRGLKEYFKKWVS